MQKNGKKIVIIKRENNQFKNLSYYGTVRVKIWEIATSKHTTVCVLYSKTSL